MQEEIPNPASYDVAVHAQTIGLFADQMQDRIVYFRIRYDHLLWNRAQRYKKICIYANNLIKN